MKLSTQIGFDFFNFSTSFQSRKEKSAELAVPHNVGAHYISLVPAQFFKHWWVQVVSESKTEL